MKSIEEKKLIGTYRHDRDDDKSISINVDKITDIEPKQEWPDDIKNQWHEIIPYLCGLGIIYIQDIPTLYQAFDLLQNIKRLKEIKVKLDNKSLLSKNLKKYNTICSLELKNMRQYNELMAKFFVSPKERMKIMIDLNKNKEIEKDAIDVFLD